MTKRETLYAKFEGFEEEIAHCYFLLHERFIQFSGDRGFAEAFRNLRRSVS
jgi:hypothetical protein